MHWQDEHGTLQHAEIVRRNTGWAAILTDRNVAGASSVRPTPDVGLRSGRCSPTFPGPG